MPAYDFARLSSFDFEELICDLLQSEWKTRLEIFTAGRDKGIDLRAYASAKQEAVVQCKHFTGTAFSKLASHLRREELPKIKALNPSRYFLVTSMVLTPANKKELFSLLDPYVKSQSDILGRSEINALLRKHPKVERNNFKLWLTSVTVLQRVLHNAEHCQTQFEIERVNRKLPLFVQNDAFPRAQRILDDSRVVVISGVPGIGKTTLADMLLFAHLEQGFEPVVVQGGIDEAKRMFDRNIRQVFYFDDFLGETFLQDRPELLAKNQDAALVSFMEAVRGSKASRFILTTREHILKKALNASERIGSSPILDYRCVLELSDYSFGQKARILYNHLYFSDLPEEYKRAVLHNRFYLRIIRHRNFNPRLVEWLSGFVRVKSVAPSDYRQHIESLLESPERIWSFAFEQQISEAGRSVLFSLWASSYGTEIADLELVWQSLHQHKSGKYNFGTSPHDFRLALNELEGSFLKIEDHKVYFLNPSIRDFVENLLRESKAYVVDVIDSAVRFSHVISFRNLAEERSSPALDEVLAPGPHVLAALPRVVASPHVRWKAGADGRYTGTYLDTGLESRVCALVKWAEEKQSRDLLAVVDMAFRNLEHHWKTFTAHASAVVSILNVLETSTWVFANGGAELHRRALDKTLTSLPFANHYEWSSMLTYRRAASLLTEDDKKQIEEALGEYRRQGVFTEFEECESAAEMEGLKVSLKRIQKEHRLKFRTIVRKLDKEIKRLRSSEDDGSDEDYHTVTSKKREPENEEEVHRLFASLV